MFHPWLIVLLAGFLAVSSRAADDPRAEGEARREVGRLIVESADARKRGDLAAAAALAARAVEQAGRSLREDDPEQVRAAMARFGPLCDEALRRGDVRRAVAIAGEAAGFAKDRADFATAVQWTGFAGKLAEGRLKLAPDHPVRAGIEIALAEFQTRDAMQAGDRDRAYSSGKRAVAMGRRLYPPGDPKRAWLLNLFAKIESWRGADAEALKLCEEVETETRDRPGGNEGNRVEALLRASGLLAMGEAPVPPEIGSRLGEALRAAYGDRVDAGCEGAAQVLFWSDRLERANDEVAQGVSIADVEGRLARDLGRFEVILRDAHVSPAVAAVGGIQLALFQLRMQRIAAAEETLKSLEWAIKDGKVSALSVGDYWINRGVVEVERAHYDVGRQDFEIALKQEASPLQQAQALNNLGDLLLRQGDYPAAVDRLERADSLYRGRLRDNASHALALRNLAVARDRLGRPDEAEPLLRRAIAIADAARPPDPYAQYLCRNALGNGFYMGGQFASARAEFEASRRVAVASFGAEHFHVAEADVNLGWIALAEDRTADALAAFQEALTIFRETLGAEHPRIAEVLSYVARVHADGGNIAQARSDLETALALRERNLAQVLLSAYSERDRLALVQEMRVHPEASAWPGVLDTYLDLAPGLGIPAVEQYRRILTWKGVLARHAPPRADELEDDPETRRLAIAREELLPKLRDAAFHDARGEQARALEAEVDALERRLRDRSRRFAVGDGQAARSPDEVAAVLPPRTALLDVIEIRRHRPRREGEPLRESLRYLAMLVRDDRETIRIDLGDATRLDTQMSDFLEHLAAPDEAAGAGVAGALALTVRAPLVPHLKGIEALIVSADGLLCRLPLGALPGRRPGTYWVDELAFASVPSAQSLVDRRRTAHPSGSGALIVGGVDYGEVRREKPVGSGRLVASRGQGQSPSRLITYWPALGQTRDEAEAVARIFRETRPGAVVNLLTGDRASKEALRRHITERRLIHLATHGLFDSGREPVNAFGTFGTSAQFDSYLVFAGANRGDVDALLTAGEVGRLDLRGVDLVVLSACQSGLGHLRAGQGDVGLLGALDRAGAIAVVSTLWEVGDEATNALMQAFYRHLGSEAGRQGPAWALRAAQRDMIEGLVLSRDGGSFSHPHDWAAFVLGGDPAVPVRP